MIHNKAQLIMFLWWLSFPWLSITLHKIPWLSRPGKLKNKIPWLSRFFKTRTNPVAIHWPLLWDPRRLLNGGIIVLWNYSSPEFEFPSLSRRKKETSSRSFVFLSSTRELTPSSAKWSKSLDRCWQMVHTTWQRFIFSFL